jgi:hypothetical protein
MFNYKIDIRLDDGEYVETTEVEHQANSVEELFEVIKKIEKRHTIISIKNVSLGFADCQ